MCYSVLQRVAVYRYWMRDRKEGMLARAPVAVCAVCCRVLQLQCVAVCRRLWDLTERERERDVGSSARCSVLHHVAVCCNMWVLNEGGRKRKMLELHHVNPNATHCTALHHTAQPCTTLQHTAIHCTALQNTATHCNTLLVLAPSCQSECNTLHHTAPHCTTLHHTAPHCNTLKTLQHTACTSTIMSIRVCKKERERSLERG